MINMKWSLGRLPDRMIIHSFVEHYRDILFFFSRRAIMSATENANATIDRPSAEKGSTDIEKPAPAPDHNENSVKREGNYIPQSDEEYNVTFKTWIVVWVT